MYLYLYICIFVVKIYIPSDIYNFFLIYLKREREIEREWMNIFHLLVNSPMTTTAGYTRIKIQELLQVSHLDVGVKLQWTILCPYTSAGAGSQVEQMGNETVPCGILAWQWCFDLLCHVANPCPCSAGNAESELSSTRIVIIIKWIRTIRNKLIYYCISRQNKFGFAIISTHHSFDLC